jgi:hypothetical protein
MVAVTLETVPTGADVRKRGKLVGKTPFTLQLMVENGPVVVELRLKGYRPLTKRIVATDDVTIKETLTRVRRGGGQGSGPRDSGTGSGDALLNPEDI